jgi:hypothetical protein
MECKEMHSTNNVSSISILTSYPKDVPAVYCWRVPHIQMYSQHKITYTMFFGDVHGSVHHSTIHTEKSNKMQQCIKIYYSIFM